MEAGTLTGFPFCRRPLSKSGCRDYRKDVRTGVYFAPSAMKSWGIYIGKFRAVWTKGSSNTALWHCMPQLMGTLMWSMITAGTGTATAYKRLQSEHNGCSCVHAKSDRGMFRNDEVIFYREDQVTIRYICEFAA